MNYSHELFEPENQDKYYHPDGLVYHHLQQTLQVQTDLKSQRLCNDPSQLLNEFDPFYYTPSDQFFNTPFYLDNNTPTTVSSLSNQIFYPLHSFTDFSLPDYVPEPHLDMDFTCFPPFQEYRSNSTPMLSNSFSFSSISTASSIHEEKITKSSKKKKKYVSDNNLSYYLAQSDTEDKKMTKSLSNTLLKKGRNVDKACNHCKRSHLRCDNVRPCRRCVATGKIGCQDVKHKPRGRPRLQKRIL
ncbi:uncharacterized protein B0P05DRAFT_583141 [Gilbertella persicaria]|uniref:uncharacterized protein n=1 Tax=Gilbertella persicaria TaxID=101096 RepID=UPI00221E75CA|nr:uncharacterized protein B0P05DRAFT_583141 [Gilbertella persicaria]KAI8094871.1 hypothetical protein B0P05DRAFT_583141 [Gilbertella persicaria]